MSEELSEPDLHCRKSLCQLISAYVGGIIGTRRRAHKIGSLRSTEAAGRSAWHRRRDDIVHLIDNASTVLTMATIPAGQIVGRMGKKVGKINCFLPVVPFPENRGFELVSSSFATREDQAIQKMSPTGSFRARHGRPRGKSERIKSRFLPRFFCHWKRDDDPPAAH